MQERIRLNKISLREQKQRMAMYRRFLPVLEAKKQQLLMQLSLVRKEIGLQKVRMEVVMKEIGSWGGIYRMIEATLRYHLVIREVKYLYRNIAGLRIREFREVVFDEPGYSLFMAPYSFDNILLKTREAISSREMIKVLVEQERILEKEFRKTSQRINLYEQRLIPRCVEVIRKIEVHLQDQQAAAVGVAKVAKRLSEESSYYAQT